MTMDQIEPGRMHLSVARSLMKKPVFGDDLSIRARDLVRAAIDLEIPDGNGVHRIEIPCDDCDGSGECGCGDNCKSCGGLGSMKKAVTVGNLSEYELSDMWEIWKQNQDEAELAA
jgi:RecJ-like exonuclease